MPALQRWPHGRVCTYPQTHMLMQGCLLGTGLDCPISPVTPVRPTPFSLSFLHDRCLSQEVVQLSISLLPQDPSHPGHQGTKHAPPQSQNPRQYRQFQAPCHRTLLVSALPGAWKRLFPSMGPIWPPNSSQMTGNPICFPPLPQPLGKGLPPFSRCLGPGSSLYSESYTCCSLQKQQTSLPPGSLPQYIIPHTSVCPCADPMRALFYLPGFGPCFPMHVKSGRDWDLISPLPIAGSDGLLGKGSTG